MNRKAQYLKRMHSVDTIPGFAKAEERLCAMSPGHFLSNWVFTQDEHNLEDPFSLFPGEWEYVQYVCRTWKNAEILLVPKTRQIMISWICCALILWENIFHSGRLTALVSKRGEDANSLLLRRIRTIYNFLPPFLKPKIKFLQSQNARAINEHNKSEIRCYPADPNALRSQTFTTIFSDEMAHQESAAGIYRAAMPTIKGGGRFIGVGTPEIDAFMYDLMKLACEDVLWPTDEFESDWTDRSIENWEEVQKLVEDGLLYSPMPGIVHHKGHSQNVDVLWIHYTAHPKKRTEKWLEKEKKGVPWATWRREYEIDWTVEEGARVFSKFDEERDTVEDFRIPSDWPRYRALDVGFNAPTAMLWIAVDPETEDMYIYNEYYQRMGSITTHKKAILEKSYQDYTGLPIPQEPIDVYVWSLIDPQANAQTQAREEGNFSIRQLYAEDQIEVVNGLPLNAAIYFLPAPKRPVDGIFRAQQLFELGKIKVFNSCEKTIWEFSNYVDPDDKLLDKKKPRCKNDHLVDALLFFLQKYPPLRSELSVYREPETELQRHRERIKAQLTSYANMDNIDWEFY